MTDDSELTRDEAVDLADDLGRQLYRAEDRVAFVREQLTGRTGPVDPATVLAWLDHQHCPRAESEQQQIARLAAQVAELEQRQADHLAEINQTTNQLNAVHATAIEWSEHCPPDNEGMHPTDMILANAGRHLIALIDEAARTTLDNPLTSTNTVDNPKEQS